MSLLDERRALGLCATCGSPLTDKEKNLEGVGGSYVRCDNCVAELARDEVPLTVPASPPGTPTTGSALDGRAVEMRARAEDALKDRGFVHGGAYWAERFHAVATPQAVLSLLDALDELARREAALSKSVVGLSADVTRLEGMEARLRRAEDALGEIEAKPYRAEEVVIRYRNALWAERTRG